MVMLGGGHRNVQAIVDLSDFSPCDGTAKLRINPLVPESKP